MMLEVALPEVSRQVSAGNNANDRTPRLTEKRIEKKISDTIKELQRYEDGKRKQKPEQ